MTPPRPSSHRTCGFSPGEAAVFLENLPDLKLIPAILRKERVFKKAFHTAELAAMPEQERDRYERDLHEYWSYLSTLDKAAADGETRGEARGKAKGEAKKASEIALKMKKDGVDQEFIAKYTGLSPTQIERLK